MGMVTQLRPRLAGATLALIAFTILLSGRAFAQPDQILPPVGGPGGGQFFARCAYPYILTGFELRTGDDVDAIRPMCAYAFGPHHVGPSQLHPNSYGGTGGTIVRLECPANTVVNGIKVAYEGEDTVIVNTIHVYCAAAAVNRPLATYPTVVFDGREIRRVNGGPFSGDTPVLMYEQLQSCPPYLFAVGINGRSGIWLDSVGLICGAARVEPILAPDGAITNLGPKKKKQLTACEAVREGHANNRPVPDWIQKQCIESTAVVKQAEGSAPATAGKPPGPTAAELDALATRGEEIAAQDALSAELRSRTGEGAARRGFDIGMAAAQGQTQHGPGKQRVRDALSPAEQQGFDLALSFSLQRNRNAKLAEIGAFIANADAEVAEARAAEADVFYWLGFDIASGIFGDPAAGANGNTATGPGSLGIRDALTPAAQRGFNASVAMHLNRNYR
jgi:hypothetical protein